jgi:catechol 2,3-dioxygenase-like lactoylglutathione lyase family enzyme
MCRGIEVRMLTNADLVAFAPSTDLAKARAFYAGVLGLPLLSEDDFACVFDVHGTLLRVNRVPSLTPAPFTILGWTVTDIELTMDELRERDLVFLRFPGMEQDDEGVWTAPGGARVAWFHDPDGNVLSLTQEPPR